MFREPIQSLMVACPPVDAENPSSPVVGYRLVKSVPPTYDDFKSHMALEKKCPPDKDPCSWSSCSMWNTPGSLFNVKGLPMIKSAKGIARVILEPDSGYVLKNEKTGHIDWWGYSAYDVLSNSQIERLLP